MTECPNCGRCCGYDEDGRLVCVCGYHEEYDVSNWTPQEDLPLGACNQFIRRRRALVRAGGWEIA
jgi:hypothetical protein